MAAVADLKGLAVAGKIAQNCASMKVFDGAVAQLHGDYLMEPKMDGWRILAFVGEGGHVDLYTRTGNAPRGDLPKVKAELAANFPPGSVVDGEAVALTPQDDGTILNEWGVAQSVLTKAGANAAADKISYVVFDLLAHAGIDARALPLADRRVLLERIFDAGEFDAVCLSTIIEATDEGYDALVAMGFEGAVLKRLDKPYGSDKREGGGWLKMKASVRIDVVIMGFKDGQNGFAGMVGAIIFGQHDPDTGALIERGTCSGFDLRTRKAMTDNPEKWIGRVIEIAHMGADIGKNGTGRLRHPQFKRVRKDRLASSVVLHDA